MTPLNYALALALPRDTCWSALRWIDELIDPHAKAGTSTRSLKEFGSPADMTIAFDQGGAQLVTDGGELFMTSKVTTVRFGVPSPVEHVAVEVALTSTKSAEHEQLAATLQQLLKCVGIPPRRDYGQVLYALDALETSVRLGWEIADEMQLKRPEQPLDDAAWLEVARFTQEIEDLAGLHHKACTQALNCENDAGRSEEWWESESGEASRLDVLEQQIQLVINERCAAMGLSPMQASFNRDARGLTVRLVGRDARGQWRGKLSYRGQEFVLGYHPLRNATHGMAASAQQLWKTLSPAQSQGAASEESTARQPASAAKATRTSSPKAALARAASKLKAAAPPSTICQPDVLKVLREGSWTVEGAKETFHLPARQLERKLYEQVRDFIAAAEGQWFTKLQGFSFQPGGADRMRSAIVAGEIVDPKDVGFFPTPRREAEYLVSLLGLRPGMKVLEPSGGRGALALAAAEIVGKENVICAELLPHNAEYLRSLGFTVHEGDFLQMSVDELGLFSRVIANPPFNKGADLKHIRHMCSFLEDDGRLGAILSPGFQFQQSAAASAFRELVQTAGRVEKDLEAGTFKESGTMVRSVAITLEAALLPPELRAQQRPANRVEQERELDCEPHALRYR